MRDGGSRRRVRGWLFLVGGGVLVLLLAVGISGMKLVNGLESDLATLEERLLPQLKLAYLLTQDAQDLGQHAQRIAQAATQAERLTVVDLVSDRAQSVRANLRALRQIDRDNPGLLDAEEALAALLTQSDGLSSLKEQELRAEAQLASAGLALADTIRQMGRSSMLTCFVADGEVLQALALAIGGTGLTRVEELVDRAWVRGNSCAASAERAAEAADRAAGVEGVLPLRLRQGSITARRIQAGLQIQQTITRLSVLASAYVRSVEEAVERQRQSARNLAAGQRMAALATLGVATVGLIGLFLLLDRRVIGRILRLREAMEARSLGERRSLLLDGRDEIAEMAATLDRFVTTIERQAEELRFLATTDPLTGVANRRAFRDACYRETSRARRHNQPMALAILDLDRFKLVNDTWGHAAGDVVLRVAARRWQEALRGEDILGRMGGEEFAVLLPMTRLEPATQVVERLCEALRRAPIEVPTESGPQSLDITVSLGMTMVEPGDLSIDDAFIRADRALYRAKDNGRNRVEIALATEA